MPLWINNYIDVFGLWFYWICKRRPSASNLFGNAFYVYFIFTTDWFWLPLAIFIGFKVGWLYGVLAWVVHHIMQKQLSAAIGQRFMANDALKDEHLFNDLWVNDNIAIERTALQNGSVTTKGQILTSPPKDWREEVNSAAVSML